MLQMLSKTPENTKKYHMDIRLPLFFPRNSIVCSWNVMTVEKTSGDRKAMDATVMYSKYVERLGS